MIGQINTFDVDWRRLYNGYVESSDWLVGNMLGRVAKCDHVRCVKFRDSASGNGFHVEVSCDRVGCDLCRYVFDSAVRVDADMSRPVWTRDVLWDKKYYRKGGGCVEGLVGPWVEVGVSVGSGVVRLGGVAEVSRR